ncbi:target of Nesh-SH3 [Bombina bombina]|uniref:target of Nesh-SH3 n=1 Tax=Bombina bombina TaxID=8345 RepID=UPI00235A5A81|nr:target of Nesh-SH3 [Bombina bombina]
MLKRLLILLLCGIITERLGNAQKLSKAKKLNLKVHINATGDTLTMKFLRPNNNIKLEGFILGYGSNFFSNQYIQWPENGKSYVSEVDAEPRYLISLKPNENSKKSCKEKNSEKNSVQKPLQLVVGTLTPTSVFLSWGILINPQFDWSFLNKCPNDRFYTVRYREKNKDWLFQLCPTTETVIDNLKPNTMYEFGVKDNTDDGNWSKVFPHKTIPKSKENGQSQNTYKDTKDIIQMISKDTKAFIPIVLVKQGIQNLSNLALPKSESILPTTEQSPVVKVTEPPPTPKTSEEPDDEDIKPEVTREPVAEPFTTDLSTGTLEWVRATMDSLEPQYVYSVSKAYTSHQQSQNKPVTRPYIPVPNVSSESPDEQLQTTPLVLVREPNMPAESTKKPMDTFRTLEHPRETTAQPESALSSSQPIISSSPEKPLTRLANPTTGPVPHIKGPLIVKPKRVLGTFLPVTIDVPKMSTYAAHAQQRTTTVNPPVGPVPLTGVPTTEQPKSVLATERQTTQDTDITPGILLLSTDAPQMSTYTSHVQQRISLANPTTGRAPLERVPVPATERLATKATEILPDSVTEFSLGIFPISTDVPQTSSDTSDVQQRATIVGEPSHHFHLANPTTGPASITRTSKAALANPSFGPAPLTSATPTEQPKTVLAKPTTVPVPHIRAPPVVPPKMVLATEQETTHAPESSPASEIESFLSKEITPGMHQISTDAPDMSTYAPHVQHKNTLGMHQISTDAPDISTYAPHVQHRTTLAASRIQSHSVPVTKFTKKPHQSHASEIESFLAKEITPGMHQISTDAPDMSTYAPHVQHKTTLGMHQISTDAPDISTYTPHVQHRTTLAASRIQSHSVPITKFTKKPHQAHASEKEIFQAKEMTTAGMHPVSNDAQDMSIYHVQQKTTLAATENKIHPQDPVDITEMTATTAATTFQAIPEKPSTLPSLTLTKTTTAATENKIPPQDHVGITEMAKTTAATTFQAIPEKPSTLPSLTLTKTTTEFIGSQLITTRPPEITKTGLPLFISVPKQTSIPHSKHTPGTQVAPSTEAENRQIISETVTTEAPHTYEQEQITLASRDVPGLVYTTDPTRPEAMAKTVSEESALFPLQFTPSPTPETKQSTPTESQTMQLLEETSTTLVPNETLKVTPPAPKTTVTTESSSSEFVPDITEKATESPSDEVPKIPQRMPINVIRLHIFEDPKFTSDVTEKDITPKPKEETESPSIAVSKVPKRMPINVIRLHIIEDPKVASEPETTEKPISHKPSKATQRPPSTAVPLVPDRMPINVIRVHLFEDQFEDPKVTSVPRETHTTLPPTPKTTKSNKLLRTKPVPNTTQVPLQPKTTQRTEQPQTKPVPNETQKVPSHKNKKNQQTPRSRPKPVSTESPKESSKPKIPPQSIVATLAPYKLQLSSSRPRTSVRPRTRPAQNGTSQGSLRSRPTGDFNWMTGIIPGGRSDNSKILGVSRNISMEPNNTGRKTYSVSSPPQLPVRPTSMRRRTPPNTVTGRPGSSGSILIPRAFATARPNRTSVTIKTPKKEPTTLPPKEDPIDNTVFSTAPISDVDALGKVRYTAPHVKYMRKEESVPCSITESLRYFPVEEATNQEITNPPQNPPSNLTIVTVEGCPSFVILDWEQPDNDTVTEYEVISQENGAPPGKETSIIKTNQTYSTVENLKPDTSYEFKIIPKNPLGEGPVSTTLGFNTESADPKVSEPVTGGKDAIWTEIKFKSDSYSECKGKQFVKRTWYKKFVGIQLCNSLRYKIYLSDSLSGTFYNIGDQSGYGEDHCQFVDSFLDGRTGQQLLPEQLSTKKGFYRSVRQQPVEFGEIGGQTRISYVHWYECGISIPGKW